METSQSTNQDPVDLNLSNEFTSLSIKSSSHIDGTKSKRVPEDVEAEGEVPEGPNHHSLWGFDEMFFGCSKMYISDVLSMTKSSQYPGVYHYRTHPVRRVDVMGVIVSIVQKTDFFIYAIDDGTGVISCMVRKPKEVCKPDDLERIVDILGNELGSKLEDVMALTLAGQEGYSLGDVIHVKGKVREFRDMREVSSFSCAKVDDPMLELCHMSELLYMYSTVYDVTPCLPPRVQAKMTGDGEDLNSQAKLFGDVKQCVNDYLRTSKCDTISIDSLLQVDAISKISDTKTLKEVFVALQEKGEVFPQINSNEYKVTLGNKELEKSVIQAIVNYREKSKGSDEGCSRRHILGQLHKLSSFSRIMAVALDLCLDSLEGQSKIISVSDYQYIVFD